MIVRCWESRTESLIQAPLLLPREEGCLGRRGFIYLFFLVAQPCPTLWDPMDCSLPGSSVHGSLQARILKWVAIPFSKGSTWLGDWTWVSSIAGKLFTTWATIHSKCGMWDDQNQHYLRVCWKCKLISFLYRSVETESWRCIRNTILTISPGDCVS